MAYSTNKESPVFSAHAVGHKPYAICSFSATRGGAHMKYMLLIYGDEKRPCYGQWARLGAPGAGG